MSESVNTQHKQNGISRFMTSTHHVMRLQNDVYGGFVFPHNCQSDVSINDKVHPNISHSVTDIWTTFIVNGSYGPIRKQQLSPLCVRDVRRKKKISENYIDIV